MPYYKHGVCNAGGWLWICDCNKTGNEHKTDKVGVLAAEADEDT